jgi:hypothetical protein
MSANRVHLFKSVDAASGRRLRSDPAPHFLAGTIPVGLRAWTFFHRNLRVPIAELLVPGISGPSEYAAPPSEHTPLARRWASDAENQLIRASPVAGYARRRRSRALCQRPYTL